METASSYDDRKAAAVAHDKKSGVVRWKTADESKHSHYASIRRRLKRLRRLKANQGYAGVLFAPSRCAHFGAQTMITYRYPR